MRIAPTGELRQRLPRKREARHLAFIRRLPCSVPGCRGRPVHAAHIRSGSLLYDKRPTGAGEKPDDKWAVPLCAEHHLIGQHGENEIEWWDRQGVDPFGLAVKLYAVSGDVEAGALIVRGQAAGTLPF